MGYYTDFYISAEGDPSTSAIISFISDFQDNQIEVLDFFEETYSSETVLNLYSNAKWYNWQSDMQNVSALYPNVIFYMEGKGEDNDDMWKAVVKNGNSLSGTAEIVYPELDVHMLPHVEYDPNEDKVAENTAEDVSWF